MQWIATGEGADSLADGIAHAQTRLPGRGNLIMIANPIAVFALERGQGVEGGDDLGVEAGHDDGDAEEHGPKGGLGIHADGLPKAQLMLGLCDVAGLVNPQRAGWSRFIDAMVKMTMFNVVVVRVLGGCKGVCGGDGHADEGAVGVADGCLESVTVSNCEGWCECRNFNGLEQCYQ